MGHLASMMVLVQRRNALLSDPPHLLQILLQILLLQILLQILLLQILLQILRSSDSSS